MHTGHDERTRAVIEQAKRRGVEREIKTRVELPVEAHELLLELTHQMERMKERDAEREQDMAALRSEVTTLKNALLEASAHLTEAA